ncbi:RNA pseudouridine synthase [Desulfonema ishimotonii]|uniref:RNA pseudouridine synthase n=1 Tax=Desulfonema ishimotonii TaxID=45657 RepID=A0A401FUG8_9BACT|nr:RNA pseudouridine synthase [Desulfonema ishimotonii]GBC60622.1 RNA pseudouridine synthase [Desulfonema ishimotonii]
MGKNKKQDIIIPVLRSGSGWLAVEKPAGISVHNDPGQDLCSIMVRKIAANAKFAEEIAFNPESGLNPVHRLDKQTSGVILLAWTPAIFRYFSAQFESGSVKKRYAAILHGELKKPETPDGWGLWEWALCKEARGRRDPVGKGKKADARTRFRVLQHTPHYTLAECELLTGRKHQIRRHARLAGHAVTGDTRYGTSRSVSFLKDRCHFDRLGLHAMSLTVTPPGAKDPVTIRSQGLPAEMQRLLDNDRAAD